MYFQKSFDPYHCLIRVVKRPAGSQPSFSNLDGARRSVERQEEEDEREEVKEKEEGEKGEEEKEKVEVVWTSPEGTEDGSNTNTRHPNPLNRARERRRARLQAELLRPPEGQECPKLIDRVRSLGQNDETSVDCFCGECN